MSQEIIVLTIDQAEALFDSWGQRLLNQFDRKQPEPEKSERVLLPEACNITGLSKSKIYKLVMDQKIPFAKFGRRLVFSRKQLQDWVKENTKEVI